jgi:2,4-dienoyl-CoA reductase-like NADH-dependent reductase (Old Yellow Enzyme family)
MMSPMCQYSAHDGFATDWHLVHLGSRAVGGIGLICVEASAVSPEGRISAQDLGIWSDDHIEGLKRITSFIAEQGAASMIQLAHSGRKGSKNRPWEGDKQLRAAEEGGWTTLAPSALAWSEEDPVPQEMSREQIGQVVKQFQKAAERAQKAGFDAIELHAAHGYLLHEFLSPITNHRTDEYGGSFENRIRFLLEVTKAVREVWPDHLPLFVRLSVTDAMEWKNVESWTVEQSIELARLLKDEGVDVIDCSSGGLTPEQQITGGSGYQTPYAAQLREQAGIPTIAVGLITEAAQADHILRSGQADLVAIGRELMRDPYFALHAAETIRMAAEWPMQYLRAKP